MDIERRLKDDRCGTNKPLQFIIGLQNYLFKDVKYVSTNQLGAVLASLENANGSKNKHSATILFDVREKEEYQVSHINGAEFIDFDDPYSVQFQIATKVIEEISRKNALTKNIDIYVYCAVGMRASLFTSGLQKHLKMIQTKFGSSVDPLNQRVGHDDTLPYSKLDFHVVEGSIIKWALEDRPMVDSCGFETCVVHRYSELWSVIFLDKKIRNTGPVRWLL